MKPTTRHFLFGMGAGCLLNFVVVGLLIFAMGMLAIWQMSRASDDLPAIGLRPPRVPTASDPIDFDWHLHDLDGERFELSTLRGRPMVLNFWATWCGPCIREMPSLEALAESFTEEEVAFLLLSEESMSVLSSFLDKNPLELPVLRVAETPEGVSFPLAVPTTWIVDADGEIVFRHVGAADWGDDSVIDYLRTLVAEVPADS